MKFRISTLILALVVGMGAWAYSTGALNFNVASVGTTFTSIELETSARDAIKDAMERYDGTLDIAVSDFSDTALQFVLIRLSNERPIRLLLGRGGATEEAEVALCQQLNDLFEVRFVDDLGHHFAVVGGRGVVMSSLDWTQDTLNGIMPQSVTEIDGESVASAFTAQFNELWTDASSSCSGRIVF
jgi:hypothetical protein